MFRNYDSSQAVDLLDEVALARKNPIEIGQLHARIVEPGGLTMADPEWALQPVLGLLRETATEVIAIGRQYDHLPDLLSRALYGTHDLWPLLMHLNGAGTRAEFRGPRARVVSPASGPQLLRALRFARARAQAADARGIPAAGDLTVRAVPVR